MWVAQGEYVSDCASRETQGFYFAHFWAFYMSSQVVGNAVGGFMIEQTSGPMFFFLMGLGMLFVTMFFCCIRKPIPVLEKVT